jgi:hypothetical protein
MGISCFNEANKEVAPATNTPTGSGVSPDDGAHGSFPLGKRCSNFQQVLSFPFVVPSISTILLSKELHETLFWT